MIVESMLAIVIALLFGLIWLILRRPSSAKDVQSAVTQALTDVGLGKQVGEIGILATQIRADYKSLDQMLRTPTGRGSFGEMSLEKILADHLPKDMYRIRQVVFGKTPDAHILSTVGTICIDSKFALDNYRKMIEATQPEEIDRAKKQFLKDVDAQLQKIAEDYVCPEKGSADFAFAYIPSEGVYWFLATEAFDLLNEYTKKGVQVVSPLTLGHKMELIKAGVHAKKLSEEAQKVQGQILRLGSHFKKLNQLWSTLYDTHVNHLKGKADEFESSWKLLREEFDRIESLTSE
jgi:DNA recombination protein RmuC